MSVLHAPVNHRHEHVDLAAVAEAAARSGHPAVALRACAKRYGTGNTTVHALRDIDLEVWPGEFLVILGPSGSGKTTLLNLTGGIEPATAGSVTVAGVDIAKLDGEARTAYRRDRVGFVFQFFNLVPTLTAVENVQLLAEVTGGDAQARSRAALARVGLGDVTGRFPGELSGASSSEWRLLGRS